jgi:hypothetical protein
MVALCVFFPATWDYLLLLLGPSEKNAGGKKSQKEVFFVYSPAFLLDRLINSLEQCFFT